MLGLLLQNVLTPAPPCFRWSNSNPEEPLTPNNGSQLPFGNFDWISGFKQNPTYGLYVDEEDFDEEDFEPQATPTLDVGVLETHQQSVD